MTSLIIFIVSESTQLLQSIIVFYSKLIRSKSSVRLGVKYNSFLASTLDQTKPKIESCQEDQYFVLFCINMKKHTIFFSYSFFWRI